jgi:hypothetical protein
MYAALLFSMISMVAGPTTYHHLPPLPPQAKVNASTFKNLFDHF